MNTLLEMWEEATSDFVERYDRNLMELAELLKQSGGKGRVPWKKIPAARLKRIWLDYGKTLSATTSREGIVRDEKGLEEIADIILDNIARLRAATEMMGHTPVDAREMLDDMGYTFTDQEWDDWMTNYFTDERGNWTLSDYGLPKLEELYAKIYGAQSAEEKLRWIDKALNVVHQRSDLAALFVEGGSETLREIFDQGGYTGEPVKEALDPDEVDPKAFVRSMDLAGYAVRYRDGKAWLVRYPAYGDWTENLAEATLFPTHQQAEEEMLSLHRMEGCTVVPVWRQKDGSLTESEAEEFDPDMPSHKLAKDFALNLDRRGAERSKELEKFNQWQGGDWVIPHTYIGYEADFDNQANHGYFKEKYPWLRAAGQTLGFDDTKFPDEYDSFELFIGQIDQTEWESFIEDVGAVYDGICMDDDKATELENEESTQSMKAYWLPEIKKQLLIDPRFQEPELQKEIPQLTTDDLWEFAHEYSIYPEREGYGNVTFDIEHLVSKIQPEDILGVTKPPKQHPEFKFESRQLPELWQEAIDPDVIDPKQYLRSLRVEYGFAVKPPGINQTIWYTDNVRNNYWSTDPKLGVHFPSVQRAKNYMALSSEWLAATLPEALRKKVVIEPMPEFQQEALDPDEVDPRHYLRQLKRPLIIVFQGSTNPLYYAPIIGMAHQWSQDVDDAKRFWSADEAQTTLKSVLKQRGQEFAQIIPDPTGLSEPPVQEALDPDAIDHRQYLRSIKNQYIIKHPTLKPDAWWKKNLGWIHTRDRASRFPTPEAAQEFARSGEFEASYWERKKEIIVEPWLRTAVAESDPDVVDPHEYLKHLRRGYVARAQAKLPAQQGELEPVSVWFNDNPWGWWASASYAKVFDNPHEAEQARASLPKDKQALMVVEPHEQIMQEALDPDAIDPKEYTGKLDRFYGITWIKNPDAPVFWCGGNRFTGYTWDVDPATAMRFPTKGEAEDELSFLLTRLSSSFTAMSQVDVAPLPYFRTQEALDPDAVDPRQYFKTLKSAGYVARRGAELGGEPYPLWFSEFPVFGWVYDKSRAKVYLTPEAAQQARLTLPFDLRQAFTVEPVGEFVEEARIQRKQLPPEEEIDYKQWTLHGGYDSGTEIYSDANVRIFRPSTMETWEKYMPRPSRDWLSFEEPGPIFIVIPTKGTPWAFREYYDQISTFDANGHRWDATIGELLKKPEGARVGQVMAAYYKKKLRQDFDKYFPWVFEFGGLKAVRGYLHRIKPGVNDGLDNAIGIHAAESGNFKLAAKFWNYPISLMSTDGVWITVDDWQDLTGMFEESRHSDWQKAAEAVFNGETYDWFEWVWETPVKVEEIEDYLTPEHYKTIREALVGRTIIIDGEVVLLSPQVLETYKDDDILEWLKNADDYGDGRSLDDIEDALKQAERRALEQAYVDAYYVGYTGAVEDVLGKSKWLQIEGKDKLGFQVSWQTVREAMVKYEEDNSERYGGSLPDLLIEYGPKISPAEEYHGSLDDSPEAVKESISNELSELEPGVMPEHRPDPAQPELPIGVPQLSGKKMHVTIYNEHYPNGTTVTMRDRDWEKFKREKPQETSKEAWDAYAKEHNIKPKLPTQEGLEPDDIRPKDFALATTDHLALWPSPVFTGVFNIYRKSDGKTVGAISRGPDGKFMFSNSLHAIPGIPPDWAEQVFDSPDHALNYLASYSGVRESLLQEGYDHAVTLIKLPRQLADFVVNWGKVNVPDDWLYTEDGEDKYGRENEPHVTILYGITSATVSKELKEIAATTRPFPVFIEKISLFDTNPKYDVVKIDIESPWLHDLNKRIRADVDYESDFPEYHPHTTIAYVRKGVADKLVGTDMFVSGEVKPQFIAHEMEFKGACEQDDDDPERTVEVIRFSTQKEPQVKEALDPDDVNPREYLKGATAKYFVVIRARDMMPAYYSERMNTWTWNKEDATPFDREIAIRVAEELTFKERDHVEIEPVTEALDLDAIDPKQYLKKAVRWPCAKCGRDLGAPESVIREYFSRHGHDPVHSLGHYDAEGSFEPDTSATLTAELHGYDLADDSDSCSACGESTMEKIQEAFDPDALDPKQALKNVGVHYAIRKIGNPKLPPWWWNSQWGWGAHRARQRFDSRIEADDMIRERGLQGVGEVVPIIEETRTPDPFGGLSFPTDASQVARFLRKKRHRRPAVL